jgi:hypothetical protein
MNETLKGILMGIAGAAVFFVALALVFVVFGWIDHGVYTLFGWKLSRLRRSMSPETARRLIEVRRARLSNPQFGVLEAHFGAPVPESLKRLYLGSDLLEQQDFRLTDPDDTDPEGGEYIAEFLPADKQALDDIVWDLGAPLFPFASDDFGNYYCVLIQGEPPDPCPVYFWNHEIPATLDGMKIADSLDEFIVRPRAPGPGAEDQTEFDEREA